MSEAPGRNDACPCGSGKKFKKCCLGAQEAAKPKLVVPTDAKRAGLGAPDPCGCGHDHGPEERHEAERAAGDAAR